MYATPPALFHQLFLKFEGFFFMVFRCSCNLGVMVMIIFTSFSRGTLGGAMVLGKLPVSGRPTIWMIVGQGPIALAVGAGGGCLDIFTLLYPFSLSTSLWETA